MSPDLHVVSPFEFRVVPHQVHRRMVVEVWYRGEFVATINGNDDDGKPALHVVSKYLANVTATEAPIPSAIIKLEL